jgi:hypothetical protein
VEVHGQQFHAILRYGLDAIEAELIAGDAKAERFA